MDATHHKQYRYTPGDNAPKLISVSLCLAVSGTLVTLWSNLNILYVKVIKLSINTTYNSTTKISPFKFYCRISCQIIYLTINYPLHYQSSNYPCIQFIIALWKYSIKLSFVSSNHRLCFLPSNYVSYHQIIYCAIQCIIYKIWCHCAIRNIIIPTRSCSSKSLHNSMHLCINTSNYPYIRKFIASSKYTSSWHSR